MTDREIIRLLFDRAESAIDALRKRFDRRLFKLSMNILSDRRDAEEAVSDTYLALWDAIPPLVPDPLEAYVLRTGRNIAIRRLRYNTARQRFGGYDVPLEELAGCLSGSDIESLLDSRELGRAINDFLAKQCKENRQLFLWRYWYGHSVRDIAAALGIRENAAYTRLSRLRGNLKDYLIKEGLIYEP